MLAIRREIEEARRKAEEEEKAREKEAAARAKLENKEVATVKPRRCCQKLSGKRSVKCNTGSCQVVE